MTSENKITAMIVDDEDLARQVLRELIASHPEIEIIAECANGFEAVRAIGDRKPDLLFLDIQMPKLDGFEVLELAGTDIAIIFTTAYDEYALKAFEVHAVDYLLKPFGADRFEAALRIAKQRIGGTQIPLGELAQASRSPGEFLDRVVVRDGVKVTIIPATKIDYIEAQDDYIAIASEGKKHLKQQTIGSLEAALDPRTFLRIHRSYILNVEQMSKIEPYSKDSKVAVLKDGTQLPISRSGYARLCEVLEGKR
jgi:two-component system, LytTR family, response regulator